MRRLLTALFLLAVVATAFSAAGWAAQTDPLAELAVDRYEVRWTERRAEKQYDGELAEGAEKGYALDLAQDNLTRVDLVLSWVETGDSLGATAEDTFRLTAVDADGAPVGSSPARGSGNVLVLRSGSINAMPEPLSLEAGDLGSLDGLATSEGRGVWRVAVTLENAGNPAGQKVDKGNTYVLTLVLRWYEASWLKSVSLQPPQKLAGVSDSTWEYATWGLGAASMLLGGLLVLDRKRVAR